ncbi:hypothetical protein Leryth_003976 [Lithospermum erythrorhizon]|nr:hypothetical protein Leryth_003976 [Lithospermum erythrorhizon]
MASIVANSKSSAFLILTICIFFLSISITILASNEEVHNAENYVMGTSRRKALDILGKEKLSHLRLFWHDVVSGPRRTSVTVIVPPTNNTFGFGVMNMIDNALTTGQKLDNSAIVGRAQGLYASASQKDIGLLMVMNLVFTKGKYNGSSLSLQGRNAVLSKMREMPIVGGSGLFRFARGYAEAQTRWIDRKTGDATVEYNIYVLHY